MAGMQGLLLIVLGPILAVAIALVARSRRVRLVAQAHVGVDQRVSARPRSPRHLCCVCLALLVACGGQGRPAEPPSPAAAPPASGATCADWQAFARRSPAVAAADSSYVPPRPTRFILPPDSVLMLVGGDRVTYEVRVDTGGVADVAHAQLRGVRHVAALRALQATFERYSYYPARLHGCAVPGMVQLRIDVQAPPWQNSRPR
jgi:hypothetical protein